MRIPSCFRLRSAVISTGCIVLIAAALPAADRPAEGKREQIGESLGKPVYRDQIRKEKGLSLRDELFRLFTQPVMEEYRGQHKAEVTPTAAEIDAATALFDQRHRELIKDKESALRDELKSVTEQLTQADLAAEKRKQLEIKKLTLEAQLKPPGRQFAVFMLGNWKWQRHLYDKFGGGRILWQQGGIEAFDAMRTWLEAQEKDGKFEITDAQLRKTFYEYWTTQKHGSFLVSDQKRIREEFLEPEWMPKKP